MATLLKPPRGVQAMVGRRCSLQTDVWVGKHGKRRCAVVVTPERSLHDALCRHESTWRAEWNGERGFIWFSSWTIARAALEEVGVVIS